MKSASNSADRCDQHYVHKFRHVSGYCDLVSDLHQQGKEVIVDLGSLAAMMTPNLAAKADVKELPVGARQTSGILTGQR